MDEFFIELERPVYRFLLRLTGDEELARDLTQDTLARGLASQKQLRELSRFRAWLFRIAVNLWNDHCRKNRNKKEQLQDEPQSFEPAPSDLVMEQELGEQVWKALAELPPRQQQVMHLRIVEEMTLGEIAEVLELSNQAVRSNLAAARKTLRVRFKNCGII